jgi:D-sedoheptulose 7-phosphate isomerase
MSEVVDQKTWLKQYFDLYKGSIFNNQILDDLINVKILWENAQANGKKVIFAGNGGSAAMASHCSVDLTKNAGLRAVNFNEADLITCFSNDYGYDKWVEKAVEFYGDKNDVLVLISSSGRSPNMINAAEKAKQMKIEVITFSGFDADNPLRSLGNINFWVSSKAYNIIEMTHHIWLLAIVDMIIGNAEYDA